MSDGQEAVVLNVDELLDGVHELGRTEQDVAARTYTKTEGFKNLTILQASPSSTLGLMGACIFSALAEQATDEIPGAAEQLDILLQFGKDVGNKTSELRAERKRFAQYDESINALAQGALAIGFIDTDPSEMTPAEKLQIVRDYIFHQNAQEKNASLVAFLDDQMAYASEETEEE